MPAKKPKPVDVVVGHNVRFQRLAAGLSQEALGAKIGVTFQQVQKYEKGTNRIGASRLTQIAEVLGIPIPLLFEGASTGASDGHNHTSARELLAEPRAFRLARAFSHISDVQIQRCIVELVERIAG